MSAREMRDGRTNNGENSGGAGREMELQDFPGDPKVLYIRDEKTKAKIGVKVKGIFPELLQGSTKVSHSKGKILHEKDSNEKI